MAWEEIDIGSGLGDHSYYFAQESFSWLGYVKQGSPHNNMWHMNVIIAGQSDMNMIHANSCYYISQLSHCWFAFLSYFEGVFCVVIYQYCSVVGLKE